MIESLPQGYKLQMGGATHTLEVRSAREHELSAVMPPPVVRDTSNMLVSPMPGVLVSLAVEVGDEVEIGQELAVVEAMKMANVLRSEKKGRVGVVVCRKVCGSNPPRCVRLTRSRASPTLLAPPWQWMTSSSSSR